MEYTLSITDTGYLVHFKVCFATLCYSVALSMFGLLQ